METDIHRGRIPIEHKGRDWGEASTSKIGPIIYQKLGEKLEQILLLVLRNKSGNTLISEFYILELWSDAFMLLW